MRHHNTNRAPSCGALFLVPAIPGRETTYRAFSSIGTAITPPEHFLHWKVTPWLML